MEYIIVCTVAVIASGLTLFSGFGLGTLLMPAFALFFSMPLAVGMTAIVHFANNLFKLILMGRHADRQTALYFGLPAIAAAFVGARMQTWLAGSEPLLRYDLGGESHAVVPIKLVIAALMIGFALMETLPLLNRVNIHRRHLPIGGLLSGLCGGLSGHQGALRSAFLVKCGLDKEAFVGTGVLISCLVDVMRISVYAYALLSAQNISPLEGRWRLLAAACLAAFLGAFLGKRMLRKVTIRALQWIVAALLIIVAAGLGSGLI